jgi:glutamate racemase
MNPVSDRATLPVAVFDSGVGGLTVLHPRRTEGSYRFACTGDVEEFEALGTRCLQMPLGAVRHVQFDGRIAA